MRIHPVTFYRFSLFLPLLVPLLAGLLGLAMQSFSLTVLFFSLLVGGAQYLALCVPVWFAIGRLREERKIRKLFLWLPVLFLPFLCIGIAFFFIDTGRPNPVKWEEIGFAMLYMSSIALILGYLYIGLIIALYTLADRLGWVDPRKNHAPKDSAAPPAP